MLINYIAQTLIFKATYREQSSFEEKKKKKKNLLKNMKIALKFLPFFGGLGADRWKRLNEHSFQE